MMHGVLMSPGLIGICRLCSICAVVDEADNRWFGGVGIFRQRRGDEG